MKSLYFTLLLLAAVLWSCSTTKVVQTHQQVLQSLHSKDDVSKQFGTPDQVHQNDALEEWVYNMDKVHTQKTTIQDTIQIRRDTLVSDSSHIASQEEYTKSLRFMFDAHGNIVGYKANGVDLTKKAKDSFGKTVLNVTGGILVISVLVAIELYKDGAFDN